MAVPEPLGRCRAGRLSSRPLPIGWHCCQQLADAFAPPHGERIRGQVWSAKSTATTAPVSSSINSRDAARTPDSGVGHHWPKASGAESLPADGWPVEATSRHQRSDRRSLRVESIHLELAGFEPATSWVR